MGFNSDKLAASSEKTSSWNQQRAPGLATHDLQALDAEVLEQLREDLRV